MAETLEFTGERFVPGIPGEIELEHVHRYAFARGLIDGKRVLDCACGEGYGSAILAGAARNVAGVDIDADTLAHAADRYRDIGNLSWHHASAAALPFGEGVFDAIVSFETIEHLPEDLQRDMLAEFARVLAPGGVVILSAPNRVEYSDKRGYRNPFHVHEHDRAELVALLGRHFPAQHLWHQRVWLGSTLWRDDVQEPGGRFDALIGDSDGVDAAKAPPAMYHLVVAARHAADLPISPPALSMLGDREGAELARLAAQGGEIARLDTLLAERTAALDRASSHVEHLEAMVAFRDGLMVERDADIQRLNGDVARQGAMLVAQEAAIADKDRWVAHLDADIVSLNAAMVALQQVADERKRELDAQERIIAYRGSLRWWWQLPWVRMRTAWRRRAQGPGAR